MSKLHFYKGASKLADGDGTLNTTGFTATITKSYDEGIKGGNTYIVKEGTSSSGASYPCKSVVDKVATFGAVQDRTAMLTSFHSLLAEISKQVNVEVALTDLQTLKSAGYKLCFAKKVNNQFNVVWQSSDKYLHTNEFSWVPMYQLFGSNTFTGGLTVKVTTNIQQCGLGQTCILNEYGILKPATTGGPDISLTMTNDYGLIHPGVNQLLTGIDGSTVSNPIYVAEKPIVSGGVELTPVESVRIWFQQDVQTSTMISTAMSKYIDLDLTLTNIQSCKYENGQWSLV